MAQAGEAGEESHAAKKPAAIFVYYMRGRKASGFESLRPPHPYNISDFQADKKRLEQFPVTYVGKPSDLSLLEPRLSSTIPSCPVHARQGVGVGCW